MPISAPESAWTVIDTQSLAPEAALITALIAEANLSPADRARISAAGADLVARILQPLHPRLRRRFR